MGVCLVRTRKSNDNIKNVWHNVFVLSLTVILGLVLHLSKAQDYLNPCFYCHMDVLVEMKAKAHKHWNAGVNCEACHGSSMEHVDVEDNSILPDSVWTDRNVHNLCNNCHSGHFQAFRKSAHAKWLDSKSKEKSKTIISCATCHGYHGFKDKNEIENDCLKCHKVLPKACVIDSTNKVPQTSTMNCKKCHNTHSLEIFKK